jgi:outer membrane protein OmpA-like peptidoglycan-associated protein
MKIKHLFPPQGVTTMVPRRRLLLLAMLIAFLGMAIPTPLQAQDPLYERPSWWFGGAAAGNLNFYRGSTQRLNADLKAPTAFHNGMGLGLYVAPLVEYHRATSNWGLMFQVGYDSRRGTFQQTVSPCNCPMDLATKVAYLTVEPSLRFAPGKSNFYLFGGPRFAYNLQKSFVFNQGSDPDHPEQPRFDDVKGDLSDMRQMLVSAQVGAGYDIQLSSQQHKTQWVISPFASFQPYFGQAPRTTETWNLTTVRVGLAIKLGCGKAIPPKGEEALVVKQPVVPVPDPIVSFSVTAPENIPVARKVKEIFPLRNYVFFDLGSTEIPNRYVLLKKDQVANFKEDQVELFTPQNLSGRSERQMIVYYNVLNILGDRMTKNPATTITLVGSSEQGPKDGLAMATSIQRYLIDVWKIDAARIQTDGRTKPSLPSAQPGGTRELALLREGDRRVTIESNSPALLMEFQNGPTAPLKPVAVALVEEAPLDSYLSLNVTGGEEAFTSWRIEVADKENNIQNFGPYTQDTVTIPGKSILGTRPEGNFTFRLIGTTASGKTVKKYTFAHMVLWTPPVDEETMRFSVIYEFDESKAAGLYEKYLTEVVIPKIPRGGKVMIQGYTDIIGEEAHNKSLSLARANDVKRILEAGLAEAGRSDVRFETFGLGEDENLSLFNNNYPEERFYNRTVLIDIVPQH